MAKPSVLVVGSSNTDMIIKVDRLPQSGETVLGGEFASTPGGKGANQAVGAACAGGEVTFIARIGDDPFGEMALNSFRAQGINIRHVLRDRTKPSGVALIVVSKAGQNSIAVAPGANGKLSSGDIQKAKKCFREASVLLLQLETPLATVQAACRLANAAHLRIILNPAPARRLPARLLEGLFLLTPNEIEARLLTGVTVADEQSAAIAAEKLLSRGVRNIIITMGSRGAFVASNGISRLIPGYRVDAVDTTGAGDIFNGTLAVAIGEGKDLIAAAEFANAAAALSVMRMGAQASAPTRREIEQLLSTRKRPKLASRPNAVPVRNGANGFAILPNQPVRKPAKLPGLL